MNDNEITEEQFQRAQKMAADLPFFKLIGLELMSLGIGEAEFRMEMRDDLRHPFGLLHGGVTATIIDTAMAFAVRTYVEPTSPTATIDLTVHYLRPHTDGAIRCTAKVVRAGKRIFTVMSDVFNAEGKLIATGLSTYTRV
jgi:uncharacterized protein (TIGR00369 family)